LVANQLDLLDGVKDDRRKPKRSAEELAYDLSMLKGLLEQGKTRAECRDLLGIEDGLLRLWICRLKKAGETIKAVAPTAVDLAAKAEEARDNKRLAALDRQLKRAKKCPVHHLRMWNGRCEDCEAGPRSTGMGQGMAAFAHE
jgi:hypothetical protein